MQRGKDCVQQDQYEQAISAYTEAIGWEPSRALTYLLRALAYAHIGDHEKAMDDRRTFDRLGARGAKREEPPQLARESRGCPSLAREPPDSSRSRYKAALSRANDYLQQHKCEHAILAYTEAIEFFPRRRVTYLLRAVAYDEVGEHENAEADRKTADRLSAS